jgi:hypothetical protein
VTQNIQFLARILIWRKSNKIKQKVVSLVIEWALKDVVNNKTEVRIAAYKFGISRFILSCHFVKFPDQGTTDWNTQPKMVLRQYSMLYKILIGWVFWTGCRITFWSHKDTLKLVFHFGKENDVGMPESLRKFVCSGKGGGAAFIHQFERWTVWSQTV